MSTGYCSRQVSLGAKSEHIASHRIAGREHTFVTDSDEHGHAYPKCQIEGRIYGEQAIPEDHCILHIELPREEQAKPPAITHISKRPA